MHKQRHPQFQGWGGNAPPPPHRPASRARRFPRWRPLTWVILLFNALMLLWLVTGINAADDAGKDCRGEELCENANDVGTALGAGFIVFLWMAGAVILGVIWLVTGRSGRRPPRPPGSPPSPPPSRW